MGLIFDTKNYNPDWKASEFGAAALLNLLDDPDLVHVEEDPEDVAEEEGGDDGHENHGKVVLLLSPPVLPPLAHHLQKNNYLSVSGRQRQQERKGTE